MTKSILLERAFSDMMHNTNANKEKSTRSKVDLRGIYRHES